MRQESWCLLIHQVPARPLYLRARVLNRLVRSGAVAIRKSVYALPGGAAAAGTLRAIAAEIREAGGEAFVCEANFTDRADHDAVVEAFRTQRSAEYRALTRDAADLAGAAPRSGARAKGAAGAARGRARRVTALRRRFEWIRGADPFGSPGADEAAAALEALAAPAPRARAVPDAAHAAWRGRTWVTRRGVHVDRIACAWLVRRFIDAAARFRFVADGPPRPGELGFDMTGGTFTHEGDRCSFEVLLRRSGLADPALAHIAEIVHDLDLKDGRYGRPEAAGIERLLAGMLAASPDDATRLERGFTLFDDLHRALGRKPAVAPPAGAARLRPPRKER